MVNEPAHREALASRRAAGGHASPVMKIGIQLAALEVGIVVLAVALLIGLNAVSTTARAGLEFIVGISLGLFAVAGVAEAVAAVRMPRPPAPPDAPLPSVTGIIPAYLPNEASLIIETIERHLEAGPAELQLIVAYNTPTTLPVEAALAALSEREPRLTVLRVDHSRTKAGNVNAAVQVATGEIIAVFDADHHPSPGSYERAWRWLAADADVVQGRCAVRPSFGASRLDTVRRYIVTAEFEQMYTVGHPGRARVQGFGLFGGSNGYWRAETLRRIGLDPTALTEDIDASVRVMLTGGRIVADPAIVSTELTPPSWDALCHQRLRWAQGWVQVARRHLVPIVRDAGLEPRKRIGAAWCFGMGVVLPWISALTLPLTIYGWLSGSPSVWKPAMGWMVTIGTASFVAYTGVAFRHALPAARRPWVFATFLAANFLFYAHLRLALVRLGHLYELCGQTEWRVTPRSVPRKAHLSGATWDERPAALPI